MQNLEIFIAIIVAISISIYAFTGGADFGVGIWNLLALNSRDKIDIQKHISHSIAPIWEANHVWLILILVIFFVCYPESFSQFMNEFNDLIFILLVGIVFRGASFIIKKYHDVKEIKLKYLWDILFSLTSILSAFSLGLITAGICIAIPQNTNSSLIYLLTNPFAICLGCFSVCLFAYLSSVFLLADAEFDKSHNTINYFRKAAFYSNIALGVFAFTLYFLGEIYAPRIFAHLSDWWASVLIPITSIIAMLSLSLLISQNYQILRFSSIIQSSIILIGWMLAQFPYINYPNASFIDNNHASPIVFKIVITILIYAIFLLIPAFAYLYYIFKFSKEKIPKI